MNLSKAQIKWLTDNQIRALFQRLSSEQIKWLFGDNFQYLLDRVKHHLGGKNEN